MVYLSETSPVSTETRASNLSVSDNSGSFDDARPHVVFVTGAVVSKGFQFAAARRLGLSVIIVDSASSAGPELQKAEEIDLFVPLELSTDVDLATVQVVECLEWLSRNIVGVVTFMEMAVLLASKVASAMGLPGLNPDSVAIARDKRRMREAMRAANLASVASYSIKHRSDLVLASQQVGFPAVLKPIIGADSLGVKRVDTFEDLVHAFEEGVKVMHSLCITSGLLSTNVFSPTPILPVEFLLEEYLDGPEVDIDVLLYEGSCMYAAVSDNGPTIEPYFTETYGVLPSLLPHEDQEQLVQLSIDSVLKGLNLRSGLFHIEGKMTSRGPRLIEINARLGGGPICEMHKRVSDIDLAEQVIRLSVGLPLDLSTLSDGPKKSFVYMTTNAVASGTVGSDLMFLKAVAERADVLKLICRVKPGDQVVGPEHGQPSWLVELWMEGHPQENESLVEKILVLSDEIAQQFCAHYYV
jgi:carnosine synthase